MNAFHRAFAIALFCGAAGFAHAAHAAQPTNPAAGTITENGAKNSADTLKRTAVPPPQGGSEGAEQERTAELNKQSLQSAQPGTAPAAAANVAPLMALPALGRGRQAARSGGGAKGSKSTASSSGGGHHSNSGGAKRKRGTL